MILCSHRSRGLAIPYLLFSPGVPPAINGLACIWFHNLHPWSGFRSFFDNIYIIWILPPSAGDTHLQKSKSSHSVCLPFVWLQDCKWLNWIWNMCRGSPWDERRKKCSRSAVVTLINKCGFTSPVVRDNTAGRQLALICSWSVKASCSLWQKRRSSEEDRLRVETEKSS